jgi:hypothetical protein
VFQRQFFFFLKKKFVKDMSVLLNKFVFDNVLISFFNLCQFCYKVKSENFFFQKFVTNMSV